MITGGERLLLEAKGLTKVFRGDSIPVPAVRGVDLALQVGVGGRVGRIGDVGRVLDATAQSSRRDGDSTDGGREGSAPIPIHVMCSVHEVCFSAQCDRETNPVMLPPA